jgi:hypothetical protein
MTNDKRVQLKVERQDSQAFQRVSFIRPFKQKHRRHAGQIDCGVHDESILRTSQLFPKIEHYTSSKTLLNIHKTFGSDSRSHAGIFGYDCHTHYSHKSHLYTQAISVHHTLASLFRLCPIVCAIEQQRSWCHFVDGIRHLIVSVASDDSVLQLNGYVV